MPRRPRVLLEGGHYHVYNRCARGEEVFADAKEARAFLDLLREVRDRDGLTVLAWCLMSNHYHLAVRTASVSLARSMKAIQGGYSRSFNRRWGRTGPLWQSRYQAKLVGSLEHLAQVVVYIHLNPVRAGIVGRAEEYRLSGHREILGKVGSPLLNVNESLLTFGETVRAARSSYLDRVRVAEEPEGEAGSLSLRGLWDAMRPDQVLEVDEGAVLVDHLGRSTGPERAAVGAWDFLRLACEVLGVEVDHVCGSRRDLAAAEARQLLATVGIERWGQRAGPLGQVMRKHPDAVSRWARLGATRRASAPDLATAMEQLDRDLCRRTAPISGADDPGTARE